MSSAYENHSLKYCTDEYGEWATCQDGPLLDHWLVKFGHLEFGYKELFIELNQDMGDDAKWYVVLRVCGNTYYRECPFPPVEAGPFDSLDEAKAVYVVLARMKERT